MLKDQHSAVRDLYAFEKRLEYEAEEAADKKRRGISDDEPFSPAVAKAKRKAAAEKKAKAAAAAAEKKSAALRARNWVKGTPTSYEHPPAAAFAHNPLLARARQYKEVGDEAEEVAMNYVRWSPRGGPHPPPTPVDAAEQPPSRPRTALPHKEPAVVVLSARARTPISLTAGGGGAGPMPPPGAAHSSASPRAVRSVTSPRHADPRGMPVPGVSRSGSAQGTVRLPYRYVV